MPTLKVTPRPKSMTTARSTPKSQRRASSTGAAPLDCATHERMIANLAKVLQKTQGKRAQLFRTHISSILVCGENAYKFRRPVKLPFADFSTLKHRTDDCWREWRLNQRTAAPLYVGVVQITGTPDAPSIGGHGVALDTALQMQRFKQTDLLSHLVQTQQLSAAMVTSLGNHLGEFMHQLPPLPVTAFEGQRTTIEWLRDSLDEIIAIKPEAAHQMQNIALWANKTHRRLKHTIRSRQKQGFYRDGHGDLHLDNLVRYNGRVMAFDALEFNTALRQTDMINDIAFTFMDLLAAGRADLAWTLINAWCEQTGDYDGLKLLRFYTLYRAVVRAKVAAMTEEAARFERYKSLALRLIAPANPPRLILLSGLSGSGKSTVAADMARELSAIRLRADVVRKHLFANCLDNHDLLYSPAATQKTYAELARLAKQLLEKHMTVIVDATFLSQTHVNRFNRLARTLDIECQVFECHAPLSVLRRRITLRASQKTDPSDATLKVLEQQVHQQQSKPVHWPVNITRINTNCSRARLANRTRMLVQGILTGYTSHLRPYDAN